jgi:5-methylcytosine-specific restriction endonuclease McrA
MLGSEWNPVDKPKHKRRAPKRAKRNEFPPAMKKKIKRHYNNTCQECLIVFDDSRLTIHHVWPRSKSGRGVFTNGLPFCWVCHGELELNDELKRQWQEFFEQKYGKHYYQDKYDLLGIV